MKIGLLECDHVAERSRHIGGDYYDMFAALFPDTEIVRFDVCMGQFPTNLTAYDAYICTGSSYSVYDQEGWIIDLQAFVQELYAREIVYVGVCFGHQMLGQALGGRVEKASGGWCAGRHSFNVIRPEDWMTPFQKEYNLLMMCQDQIVQLPPDSRVLATAADCPIGMLQVGPRTLGLQAHPEFPAGYVKVLLEDRVERIGAEKVRVALESLALRLDAGLIGIWIQNFIRSHKG